MADKTEVQNRVLNVSEVKCNVKPFEMVYIDDIVEKVSHKIGNCYAFWYKNGEPLITIGPHCYCIKQGHCF